VRSFFRAADAASTPEALAPTTIMRLTIHKAFYLP
jgi:hypothetical protein